MDLTLRPPTPDDEAACRRLHEQLAPEGFSFLLADGSWDEVLATVTREAAGTDLPADRVRAEYLLAEVDGEVVGRVSIRYALTDWLRRFGGNVGYAVGPEFRRRGYAHEILRQAVERLAAEGLDRVLVTCDDSNAASAATIESCGGVLENVVEHEDGPRRRYWIDPWECRIEEFWRTVDLEDREGSLAVMRVLVAQQPDDDAAAHYELGGIHDSLGLEAEAQVEYDRARSLGLTGSRLARLNIQQGSTLRNLGRVDEAVAMLEASPEDPAVGDARAFFLALALNSAGRADEALQTALRALVPHLPRYQRSAAAYAEALTEPEDDPR